MKKKNPYRAFTLIEVLVVISVIGIITLWISSLDFNRLSQSQKIDIEISKIHSIFEEVRNNSLIGKWVWTNLQTPSSWEMSFENTSSSGSIDINYISASLQDYREWESPFPFAILNMQCKNLNYSNQDTLSTALLSFSGSNISLSSPDCTIDKPKILEIEYGIWTNTKTISINTLSGIIE